jgi:hypothetical protein
MPCVSEMNIGARPGGSSVTRSVASVEEKKSCSMVISGLAVAGNAIKANTTIHSGFASISH